MDQEGRRHRQRRGRVQGCDRHDRQPAGGQLEARAGAIIIGRTNTPAFSLRWHTDNDLRGAHLQSVAPRPHARWLQRWRRRGASPWASRRSPTATILGGSVRYPAYCLWARRHPAHSRSRGRLQPRRSPRSDRPACQLMSVQGPLARRVARRAPRPGRHGRTRPARCLVGAGAARRACSRATVWRGADHQPRGPGGDAGSRRGGARGRRSAR